MVSREVVVRARHRDAGRQQLELECPETLLTAAIDVGDERMHLDAACDRRLECFLELFDVETKDDDLDALRRPPDGGDERHQPFGAFSGAHSTAVSGSLSSAMMALEIVSVLAPCGNCTANENSLGAAPRNSNFQ